jgi:hypothetical protein
LQTSYQSPDQLDHIARCWNACRSKEETAMKHFQDLDLFNDLFGMTHPRKADDLLQFSADVDRYCTHFKKCHPISDSEHVFFKDFITKPCSIAPEDLKPRVWFSGPPIAMLNPPQDPTLHPVSEVPILNLADFPPLVGKPFGNTWTTVTTCGKKKKLLAPKPQTSPLPAQQDPKTLPSGQASFVAAAVTLALNSTATPTTAKSHLIKPRIPDALWSTWYLIILNHSHADIRKMLGIDMGHIFRNIRANLERVNAPLTLLAGHWSSATINKNFILTFAGLQKRDDIAKYDAIFFHPFGPDCRGTLTVGYRTALLCGVPLVRDPAGRLPSPQDLDNEIRRNAAFKGVLSLAPPWWLYNPDRIDPNCHTSSIIIAFYDPEHKIFDTITKTRNAVAMFGSFVTVRAFENQPSFSQCSCCLRLGHSIECCNCLSSLVVCPYCGGPHQALEHAFRCPNSKHHHGKQCSCPPHCFLCAEKKKKGDSHHALSPSCPLCALYRTAAADSDSKPQPHATMRPAPDLDDDVHVLDAMPSDAETLPPTPGAAGPFTLAPAMMPAALTTLHQTGADDDTLIRSLVSSKAYTKLQNLQK